MSSGIPPPFVYNPIPTRTWSRVQPVCPAQWSPADQAWVQQLRKEEVLRHDPYRHHQETRAQRMSRWARYTSPAGSKGQLPGVYGGSQGRVGATGLAVDPARGTLLGPTSLPFTCPFPPAPSVAWGESLPLSGSSGSSDPLPPPSTASSLPVSFPVIPRTIEAPWVLADGGFLQCVSEKNGCTGIGQPTGHTRVVCADTSCSDVPGPLQVWCTSTSAQSPLGRTREVRTMATTTELLGTPRAQAWVLPS
jgi:hypothetical protein